MNNSMIKDRDIVIVGLQPWDVEIGSNCKNIALEFAKHNRVLYVNSPLDRITLMRHKNDPKIIKRRNVIKGNEPGIVQISDNLWNYYPDKMIESINWIKNRKIFNLFNRINNKRFAASIKKAMDELEFSKIILFNDNDIFRSFYLREFLQPDKNVYYSRDYLLAVDYWKYHGEALEPLLIEKSDVCVANSVYLADYCREFNPRSRYVGQGCELEMFINFQNGIPRDVANIKSPVIGYVGALQSIRLDINILMHIAMQRSYWNIVLVGPEDEQFKKSKLHRLNNVYFTGAKQPHELPAYIHAFDVCINPQLINNVTIGNYPRKIDEYLAMGKPVVATKTAAMSIFAPYTYLAATREDYLRLIEQALRDNTGELQNKRKAFASTHTWQNSVNEIYKAINDSN